MPGSSPGMLARTASGTARKLYSRSGRSSVDETLKSKLKSLASDDTQGKLQPIRERYPSSLSSGARETATKLTSWCSRCTRGISMWSISEEQLGQPSSQSGPNMKWYVISCEFEPKSSASVFVPSSVSNVYSVSTGTQGSAARSAARSSDRRVSSFSRSSSARREASPSLRVPVLCFVMGFLLVEVRGQFGQRLGPAGVDRLGVEGRGVGDPFVLEPQFRRAVLRVAEGHGQERVLGSR